MVVTEIDFEHVRNVYYMTIIIDIGNDYNCARKRVNSFTIFAMLLLYQIYKERYVSLLALNVGITGNGEPV